MVAPVETVEVAAAAAGAEWSMVGMTVALLVSNLI
jgi:hypothetical protein